MFLDKEGGGYFNTAGEDPSVLLRVKEDHDGAEPSGNSVSVINLVRLASIVSGSKSDSYKQNAEHVLVSTRLLHHQAIFFCCFHRCSEIAFSFICAFPGSFRDKIERYGYGSAIDVLCSRYALRSVTKAGCLGRQ